VASNAPAPISTTAVRAAQLRIRQATGARGAPPRGASKRAQRSTVGRRRTGGRGSPGSSRSRTALFRARREDRTSRGEWGSRRGRASRAVGPQLSSRSVGRIQEGIGGRSRSSCARCSASRSSSAQQAMSTSLSPSYSARCMKRAWQLATRAARAPRLTSGSEHQFAAQPVRGRTAALRGSSRSVEGGHDEPHD
jgi:hypothetical protein